MPSGAERIGGRVEAEGIRAEVAEVLSVKGGQSREYDEQKHRRGFHSRPPCKEWSGMLAILPHSCDIGGHSPADCKVICRLIETGSPATERIGTHYSG